MESPENSNHKSMITMQLPSGSVTFEFGTPDTRTLIPAGSRLTVPLHWHETHTEHFKVLRGYALVTVGLTARIISPRDGTVDIPPFTLHSFSRADVPEAAELWAARRLNQRDGTGNGVGDDDDEVEQPGWKDEEIVLLESTTPADGRKEVFFRHTIGYFNDHISPALPPKGPTDALLLLNHVLRLMSSLSHLDNHGAVIGTYAADRAGKVNLIGRLSSYSLEAPVRAIGWALGWNIWSSKYIPQRLVPICKEIEAEGWLWGKKESSPS